MNRVRRLRLVSLLLMVATIGAACAPPSPRPSPSAQPTSPTPGPTVGAYCPPSGGWQQVWLTDAKGVSVGGVVLGTGSTAVVLAGDCEPQYATNLVTAGYKVFTLDFHGRKVSTELGDDTQDANVEAAVEYLREHGAKTIVLMGEGFGGTAALVVATTTTPRVAGVISVSALESSYGTIRGGVDARKAVPKLAVPVLYIAGKDDPLTADDAKRLYDATPGSTKTLLVVDDGQGQAILDHKDVLAATQTFLKRYAPPTG